MTDGGRRRPEGSACRVRDNSITDRMMLRFRPILPKPNAGVSVSGVAPAGEKNLLLSVSRKKRRYTKIRKRSENQRTKRFDQKRADLFEESVTTLQLLPERAEAGENMESRFLRELDDAIISDSVIEKWGPLYTLGSSVPPANGVAGVWETDLCKTISPMKAVESSVTLESVTDTCMDAPALGRTDVERLVNLENDTCPGFISDGWDKILWVNAAYRKLVVGDEKSPAKITARFFMKEKLKNYLHQSFTCMVRLQYTWQHHEDAQPKSKTLTVPCDVWRMDRGGLAWRLDINAALSLGF